eukprot:scaffold252255_cov32-Tisochrysis_lutea.AAC.2
MSSSRSRVRSARARAHKPDTRRAAGRSRHSGTGWARTARRALGRNSRCCSGRPTPKCAGPCSRARASRRSLVRRKPSVSKGNRRQRGTGGRRGCSWRR